MKQEKKIKDELVDKRLTDLQNRLSAVLNQRKESYDIPIKTQAKMMGVSDTNLTKYTKSRADCDNPEKKPPIMGVDKLIRICEYLDVSADYMLGLTSDSKLMRRHTPDEAAIKQMCDYTGLSRKAIEALHNRKNDLLYTVALSFLTSNDELLSSIVEYLLTSLYDDVTADDRYNLLPGTDKSSKEEGKPLFADALELMPQYRDSFHKEVTRTEAKKTRYVSEMAIRCVDKRVVFSQLYPYISYDPTLSPDEAEKRNAEVRQKISTFDTDEDYEFAQLLRQRTDISEANEILVRQDNQLEAFYKESFEHQINKT